MTIDDILEEIFNDYIINCKKDFIDEIKEYVKLNYADKLSRNKIICFIKEKYRFPVVGSNTRLYWLSRGYSEAEVNVIIFEMRKKKVGKKQVSPFSNEFWTNKINEKTGKHYTYEEAEFKRNSLRPIRKEYWMVKGHSEEDSIIKAKEAKDSNNKKGNAGNKVSSKKQNNKTKKEYWTLRGYSDEEAENMVKERQRTFTKEKCIQKYGEIEGLKIWEERQSKWLNSLKNKEDYDEICKSRNIYHKAIKLSSKEEILNYLVNTLNLNIYEHEIAFSMKDFDNILDKLIIDQPYIMYTDSDNVFKKLKRYNYCFIGVTNEDILSYIDLKFSGSFNKIFYRKGKYDSYNLYVEEGYMLRSSHEINFYKACKDLNINFEYGKKYPDSDKMCDFYLVDHDIWIEIIGLNGVTEYDIETDNKVKEFGSILYNPDLCNSYDFLKSIVL